jgi:23S rRNA (cytidine1920-2'-O)/16S rRNA (cytidine1409-2'-O)-methyltransferase
MIRRGAVRWLSAAGWVTPAKAGDDLPPGCQIEVADDAELRYVSRGGLKLEAALDHAGLTVHGMICLDVGQSTGGFTDVLLQRGAARVVGIDVGHGQLHPRLRSDPRVRALEGINARHLRPEQLGAALPAAGTFDLIVGDVSFISLTLVLPALVPLLGAVGELLMLVKPQFELQPADIGKGGLVKDPSAYDRVEARTREGCGRSGLTVLDYFASAIAGGDGNREFFVRARPGIPTDTEAT